MGIEEQFRVVVTRAIQGLHEDGRVPVEATKRAFTVERPKRAGLGDLATNAPLTLAKDAHMAPRELAELLRQRLAADADVQGVDVAGPGFLNVTLAPRVYHHVLAEVLAAAAGYGRGAAGTGERILLEFVSANPTGPLLISHARGALVGDAVARLLEATGHHVTREYYVNDFGNQVRTFALSVVASALGEPLPPEGYPGAYVDAVAAYVKNEAGPLLEAYQTRRDDEALAPIARVCVARMLDGVPGSPELPGIKATLRSLRVAMDVWFSEEALHRWGRVAAALDRLGRAGFLETLPDGALVFQMKEGKGEADASWEGEDAKKKQAGGGRVVRKSDGQTYTYFASDIAYHADKVDRGYDRLMDVLGADHHGYAPRLRNVLAALGLPAERLDILFFQLVSLVREGKPVKMGKRLGNLITADEVLEEIDDALGPGAGADALRVFYLSRRVENPVELDVEIAKRATLDNPAIYLQYGHARLCSLLRKAQDELGLAVPVFSDRLAARLTHPLELSVLQRLGAFPRMVHDAAAERAPSRVFTFLTELAQEFHRYYTLTKNDPILPHASTRATAGWEATWDRERTLARLLWIDAIRIVYASGLALLGVQAPERMTRTTDLPDDSRSDAAASAPAASSDAQGDLSS